LTRAASVEKALRLDCNFRAPSWSGRDNGPSPRGKGRIRRHRRRDVAGSAVPAQSGGMGARALRARGRGAAADEAQSSGAARLRLLLMMSREQALVLELGQTGSTVMGLRGSHICGVASRTPRAPTSSIHLGGDRFEVGAAPARGRGEARFGIRGPKGVRERPLPPRRGGRRRCPPPASGQLLGRAHCEVGPSASLFGLRCGLGLGIQLIRCRSAERLVGREAAVA